MGETTYTAEELKDMMFNQMLAYDSNVAGKKYPVKFEDIIENGKKVGFRVYQSVDSSKQPKVIFEGKFPQGTGGIVAMKVEDDDIDFEKEW